MGDSNYSQVNVISGQDTDTMFWDLINVYLTGQLFGNF